MISEVLNHILSTTEDVQLHKVLQQQLRVYCMS